MDFKGCLRCRRVRRRFLFAAAAFFSLGMFRRAAAHDMDDPDGAWYQSLKVPGVPGTGIAGTSCCNGGSARRPGVDDVDCKNVEVRIRDGHLEAFIDSATFPESRYSSNMGHAPNAWVVVPEDRIIRGLGNPTGRPVACWYAKAIRCFVEGIQA